MFSRWDSSGGGMSLYTVNADGSGLQLLYGARSHAAGIDGNDVQFTHSHEMADGRILTLMRPFAEDTDEGGDLMVIDTDEYVENTQAVAASASLTGPAQKRITPNQVKTIEDLRPAPLPFGVSVVGWQRSHPRELVAVSRAGHDRDGAGTHRLHHGASGRSELRAGTAAVQRLHPQSRRQHLQAAVHAGRERDGL